MRWAYVAAAMIGCSAPVEDADPPTTDAIAFELCVYRVLARDCGFSACHGASDRFFQVWAPGRTRLDPSTGVYTAATPAEIARSHDRARAVLAMAADPAQSLLVRKPLAPSAGGAAHMGIDALGRDVYATRDDPGWLTLERWARGQPCGP